VVAASGGAQHCGNHSCLCFFAGDATSSRAKQNVGHALGSAAMHADAKQTQFCTHLSAILLVGLILNAALGWWWADPIAALMYVAGE